MKLKEKFNFEANLKLIDPTYAIRSVPANAADVILCAKLAENAVHGCMAGYTAFSTGVVNDSGVWIPITTINDAGSKKVKINDERWQRTMLSLGQKPLINPEFEKAAK